MKLWWWKLTYLQLKYIQPINMQKNQASFAYSILVRCSDSKKISDDFQMHSMGMIMC